MWKEFVKKRVYSLLTKTLKRAAKEQGLNGLVSDLEKIVPNITEQYSLFKVNTPYLRSKIRNMHAFQISLVDKIVRGFKEPAIVDIGDSSGTHLQYLKRLYPGVKCLSVNLDAGAVAKIREKGLEAINTRAENLCNHNIRTDIFLCFEIFEHLMNPCKLFYDLSSKTNAKYLIVTVPYLKRSRVGLHQIRVESKRVMTAENVHILELSPKDWKLLALFSGWRVTSEEFYLQYPKRHWLRITKPYWKRKDFEGFWGAILEKDTSASDRYQDWES
ncbi:hypothetical protein ACFL0T_04055 [Candidatus Omnitrophota bacterium]